MLYRIEYILFLAIASLIRYLPRSWAYSLGRFLGLLWANFAKKRFLTAYQNVEFAYPQLSKKEKLKIVYGCFKNMALSGVDQFCLDLYGKNELETLFDMEGEENLHRIQENHQSVIFLSAHLGFWESGSFVFPYYGLQVCLIAKKIKNPLIDAYIVKKRAANGVEMIDRRSGLRKMIKVLQDKKSLAIMIDQHIHKEEAVYAPFFGRNAYTSPIIVSLAAKKNLPIVPIFCYRQPKNRFKLVIHEPIYFEMDKDHGLTNTTQLNLIIENAIRKHPEQWMWLHRRWR